MTTGKYGNFLKQQLYEGKASGNKRNLKNHCKTHLGGLWFRHGDIAAITRLDTKQKKSELGRPSIWQRRGVRVYDRCDMVDWYGLTIGKHILIVWQVGSMDVVTPIFVEMSSY